jgi:hypothetical protein
MKRIVFYTPHLCLRGTTIANFDYAFYNQKILNNESIIFYDKNHKLNNFGVLEKFKKNFKIIDIDNVSSLDYALEKEKIDFIYILKGGFKDERISKTCKMLIHATATTKETEAHGYRYAYVSKWMSEHCSGGRLPYVPHMIDLPETEENFRQILGIPKDAIVFGRTGGIDTWNLPFATKAVYESLNLNKNVYYIFQNTILPFKHERIINLPTSSDALFKVKFINSCDAFLHARYEGESFGIACGEFSIKNKPVITWSGSIERNHIEILKEKGIYYKNYEELLNILINFNIDKNKNWNCYNDFKPEAVTTKFNEVFLR